MATIVWVNEQGETVRSHTLDPAGTRREIEERFGGRIVTVEQPREARPRITYHRDPKTGRVTHITKESTLIGEEPEPTPVVEPEEEPERKKYVGPPLPPIEYQRYKDVQPIGLRPAPSIPEPGMYERPGVTATPEQLATLPLPVGTIKRREEFVAKEPTPTEKPGSIPVAEMFIERRLEREKAGFEEEYQPQAQDIVQSRYDELMGERARSLGMTRDPVTGSWMYTDTGQLEKFYAYQPIAQQLALEQGTSFYEKQWEQYDMGERAEDIYREEYGKQDYELIEKDDGTFTIISKKEYERQQRYEKHKVEYRKRLEEQPVLGYFTWLAGGFTAEDPFLTKSFYESFFGEEEGRKERIFDISAKAQFKFREGMKAGEPFGPVGEYLGAVSKTVEPGTPIFTLAATYFGAALLGGAIGAVGYIAGPTVAKGVGVGVGGFFIGKSAVDVEQIAKGRLVKYGPLGIIPLALMAQEQPLTEAERFSTLAMMGISLPFAVSGYRKGLKIGEKYASQIYTPKYDILPMESYAYQKLYPKLDRFGKPITREWGIPIKGDIIRQETLARTIFGRKLPFKSVTKVSGEFEGIIGKKTMTYMDAKGRSITWRPGEFRGQLTSAVLMKKIGGIEFTKTLKKIDNVFTAYPHRMLKVDIGKKMGVAIEPYVQTDKLLTVISKHPGMTLTLTKLQAGRELFKPDVSSKFYPGETATMVKDIVSHDRAVTQMWELPEHKAVMKLPHVEKMQVSFFEYGKKIPEYQAGRVPAEAYGFTVTKGLLSEPRVFVREPGTGPPVEDMFGRKFIHDPTSMIMRHETLHRMYPYLREPEIQMLHGKFFPREDAIPSYVSRGTSVREMRAFHKEARSVVDKAVGEFWKTGEIGIGVQTGLDVYKLTGFRQVVSRVSPLEVVSGRVFGLSAALTGMEKAGVDVISEPLKAWDTSEAITKQVSRQESIIRKPKGPELVIRHPEIKVGVIDVGFGELWGRGVDVGIMTSTIPATVSATESTQQRRTVQTEVNINKLMQGELQKRMVTQVTSSLLGLDVVSAVETESDLEHRLVSAQMQLSLQATELITKTVTVTPTVSITPPVVTIIPPPIIGDFEKGLMGGVSLTPQAYDSYVYRTQFKDGRRIRGKVLEKVTKKPLRRMDALALASDIVDNTAKRTIILKPAEGKPHKPRKKVRGWASQMFEYNAKGNDVFVEKNINAIDSSGEIREITMKGIAARRRGGKRGNSGLPRSISSLESRMSRRVII